MKATKTFSVEVDALQAFLTAVEQQRDEPNRVVSEFMLRYAAKFAEEGRPAEIKHTLVLCNKCGCEFSSKYNNCPNCGEAKVV